MAGEAENGDERDRGPSRSDRSARQSRRDTDAGGGRGERPGRRDGGAGSERAGGGYGGPRREGERGGYGRPRSGGERDRYGEPRRQRGGRAYPGSREGDRRGSRGDGGRGGEGAQRYERRPDRGRSAADGEHRRPLPRGEARPPQADRPFDPPIDEDVTFSQLDRQARQRLRTLSKESAERVGRHLVMAGLLVEDDPELAYQHAQSAMRRAGRVDVVREAVALTAYATGRYAEALREIRTVRRLSGLDALRAIEADCERGLGRPERALDLAAAPPSKDMTTTDRVELALVASGARLDLGQADAALLVLDQQVVLDVTDAEMRTRVAHARVTALRAAGRVQEADVLEATIPDPEPEDDEVAFGVLEVPDAEPTMTPTPAADDAPTTTPAQSITPEREDEDVDG